MVNVVTYEQPHRKTQDVVFRLLMQGHKVHLLVLPWMDRPLRNPLYKHRPQSFIDVSVKDMCDRMGITYERVEQIDRPALIAGAGIIKVKANVINSHPGYLPDVRGLDALKWAILQGQTIGVTTHFIGDEPDTGVMIERQIVPLYPTDTFDSIAQRQYDMEIEMLVRALEIAPDGQELKPMYKANRRMGIYDEIRMVRRLKRKLKYL